MSAQAASASAPSVANSIFMGSSVKKEEQPLPARFTNPGALSVYLYLSLIGVHVCVCVCVCVCV